MVSLEQKADYCQPGKLELVLNVMVLLCAAGKLQKQERNTSGLFLGV